MVTISQCQQMVTVLGVLCLSTLVCRACAEQPSNSRLKRDAGFWKRDAGFWKRFSDDMESEEDKRAKYFLGKRPSRFFLGKRDYESDDEAIADEEWKRGLRQPFLGKRGQRQPFLGKRAKYFLGKREDGFDADPEVDTDLLDEDLDKRAKYFLGKRAKYFLGKRESSPDLNELLKRAKYFLGKRSEPEELEIKADDEEVDKRQKYFLGKRSAEKESD